MVAHASGYRDYHPPSCPPPRSPRAADVPACLWDPKRGCYHGVYSEKGKYRARVRGRGSRTARQPLVTLGTFPTAEAAALAVARWWEATFGPSWRQAFAARSAPPAVAHAHPLCRGTYYGVLHADGRVLAVVGRDGLFGYPDMATARAAAMAVAGDTFKGAAWRRRLWRA